MLRAASAGRARALSVTMTAPVSSATVDPVRIHPPTAQPALHQPGEHVIARRSVRTLPGRTTLLHRDEVRFTGQRGMRQGPGDRPIHRDHRPPGAGTAITGEASSRRRVSWTARIGSTRWWQLRRPVSPLGRPRVRRSLLREAEESACGLSDPDRRAVALHNVIPAMVVAGEPRRAEALLRHLAGQARGSTDPDDRTQDQVRLVRTTAALGELDRAEALARQVGLVAK